MTDQREVSVEEMQEEIVRRLDDLNLEQLILLERFVEKVMEEEAAEALAEAEA